IMRRESASEVTFAVTGSACPPAVVISVVTDSAAAGSRSTTATAAPSAAKRSAEARPSPEPAPVTRAILPARRPVVLMVKPLVSRWVSGEQGGEPPVQHRGGGIVAAMGVHARPEVECATAAG